MSTNSYRFYPAVSDLSVLKPGWKVWVLTELFQPSQHIPLARYFAGSQNGRALLSGNPSTLESPVIHTGPIWRIRAGALEELVEMARMNVDKAEAELARLERALVECDD